MSSLSFEGRRPVEYQLMQQNLCLEIPELLCLFLLDKFTGCWYIQLSIIPNCSLKGKQEKIKRFVFAVLGCVCVCVCVHIHLRTLRGSHKLMCIERVQKGDTVYRDLGLIWLWDICVLGTSIKHLLMTHQIGFVDQTKCLKTGRYRKQLLPDSIQECLTAHLKFSQ